MECTCISVVETGCEEKEKSKTTSFENRRHDESDFALQHDVRFDDTLSESRCFRLVSSETSSLNENDKNCFFDDKSHINTISTSSIGKSICVRTCVRVSKEMP